jgi:hypothetical protein
MRRRLRRLGPPPRSVFAAIAIALLAAGTASGGGGKTPPGKQGPSNTSPPTISGSPVVAQTLSASAGSWSGPGASYAYGWLRCDASGNGCSGISGASGASYLLAAADAGATFRVTVVATNSRGSASATSSQTAVVQPAPVAPPPPPPSPTVTAPENMVPPTISGTPQPGATLAASDGSWQGSSPMDYLYEWQACDSSGAACAAIAGASGSSYGPTAGDVGHAIRVRVSAKNSAGETTAASAPTSVVQSLPTATPQPAFPIRAAFYYPWYPETWTVNGAHVFYHPSLGYYSSTDVATQQAHIRALQYAGMNAAISSWWGPGHYTDTRLKQLMQTTISMGSPLKWAVYYENEGYSNPTVSQLASDLAYIRDNLATSSAYLKAGGKFVVFVYNANDTTCGVADRWKQANSQLGSPAYIDLKVFLGYKTCASQPSSWHQYGPNAPSDDQPGYSYSVSPGWWRSDQATPLLARDPARWKSNVAAMAASKEPWQLVTTFNEWTEGTAIESAQEWSSPSGYGTYLDALHSALSAP